MPRCTPYRSSNALGLIKISSLYSLLWICNHYPTQLSRGNHNWRRTFQRLDIPTTLVGFSPSFVRWRTFNLGIFEAVREAGKRIKKPDDPGTVCLPQLTIKTGRLDGLSRSLREKASRQIKKYMENGSSFILV